MKNKYLLLAALSLLTITGCKKKKVVLETPKVSINSDGLLTWDKVEHADKYIVLLKDKEIETNSTSYQLNPNEKACVVAFASIENKEYLSSEKSEEIEFTVTFGIVDPLAGYYNRDAEVFNESDTTRYIVYTKNTEKAEEVNKIVARKGTYKFNTDYVYGDEVTLVNPGETWDQYIGSASVVKGAFNYNNESYSYLLAYCASNKLQAGSLVGYQIGFAVGKDMEHEFVKVGTEPIITFDTEIYGNMTGCYSPSLVNYDKVSGIRLFYTYAYDYGHFVKYFDADLSNLNNINGVSAFAPNYGDFESGDEKLMIPNADFAYDSENKRFYLVKDYSPSASTRPYFATKIELGYIAEDELYTTEIKEGFRSYRVYDFIDLDVSRVYSASLVSDEYGHMRDLSKYELVYNVCKDADEDNNYIFSQKFNTINGTFVY